MSRLTRDGTTESVSLETKLSGNRDREKNIFPVKLTISRIANHNLVDPCSPESADYLYIHSTPKWACEKRGAHQLVHGDA